MIPAGAHTPMSAAVRFATPTHSEGFSSEHDWNQKDGETWTIRWTLGDGGILELARGGALLRLDGTVLVDGIDEEYPRLYAHFRALIQAGKSDVEIRPLQIVADAFMLARHEPVAAVEP
jgi:L-arabinose 1- dehydrogenase